MLFNKQSTKKPEPSPATPPKSIPDLRAELEHAKTSLEQLAAKQAEAASELTAAKTDYDASVARHSLGESSVKPSRDHLQDADERCQALRRIYVSMEGRIPLLQSALAAAELNAAVAAGKDQIPPLVASGDVRVARIAVLAQELRDEEKALFSDLFSTAHGLKQTFPSDELNRVARVERNRLKKALLEIGARFKLSLNRDFETDGFPNLGANSPTEDYPYMYYAARR